MWEKLIDLINKVFTLSSRTDRLEKDIENLNQEVKRLSILVNEHSSKIDVLVYAVQAESDKTKMWVEKEFAKFERRLPSGKEKNDEKD